MNRIILLVLLGALGMTASAQTDYPFPYNPDADSDGWISVNDLLSLLSVFSSEFSPTAWETDSINAAVILDGNPSYFECQNQCHQIEGHWRMTDMDALGRHWELASMESANFWVNTNSKLGETSNFYALYSANGSMYTVALDELDDGKRCMCYLQSSPFVPDVLTSETAGLQEQIDSLQSQLDTLSSAGAELPPCVDIDGDGVCDFADDCFGFNITFQYSWVDPGNGATDPRTSHRLESGGTYMYAQLEGADLTDGCILDAVLTSSHFYNANLSNTNLSGAMCLNAGFGNANLSGADLSYAWLYNATLTNADLSYADLSYANLTGAYLFGATWTGAYIEGCTGCICADADGDNYCDDCAEDADGDGVCDSEDVCADPSACNYDDLDNSYNALGCLYYDDCGECGGTVTDGDCSGND